jgi:hypothetical protein
MEAPQASGGKTAACQYLKTLLNKNLRISTTDSRMFRGEFKCTDPVGHPYPSDQTGLASHVARIAMSSSLILTSIGAHHSRNLLRKPVRWKVPKKWLWT